MYPEAAMLSGLFMVSPTTVKREIRPLPMLWNYFKELAVFNGSGLRQNSGWRELIIGRCFLEWWLLLMEHVTKCKDLKLSPNNTFTVGTADTTICRPKS